MYGKVALTGKPLRLTDGSAEMGRWFDVYATRVGGEASSEVALLFTDITARKGAEAERERLLAAEQVAREAAEGAGVLIAVWDAGIGLPEGAAELIFEPFGRAPNAATSRLPGMGLGLFICRSSAERHGGGLRAESAGEGQGTTVTCWLPCAGPLAVGSR